MCEKRRQEKLQQQQQQRLFRKVLSGVHVLRVYCKAGLASFNNTKSGVMDSSEAKREPHKGVERWNTRATKTATLSGGYQEHAGGKKERVQLIKYLRIEKIV